MTIEIKPAEIVGASIGDHVTWSISRYPGACRYDGRLKGVTTYAEHTLLLIENEEGEIRHVHPEVVRLMPRTYAVGDTVGSKDAEALPDGALVAAKGYLPLFKSKGDWYAIDPEQGTFQAPLAGGRTIVWLPYAYLNQND